MGAGPSAAGGGLPVAGVDLGERRTKLVVLNVVGGRPALVAWADEPTPAGLFFGGRPVRPIDAGAWVRRLFGQAGVRPESLVMAVPGGDVQIRRLPVPDAGDREATLRSLAASPAFRAGGEGGSSWSFDYHVLDPEAGTVLAVAARQEGIHAVQAVARAAGFSRERRWLSVGEVALVNAWEAVTPDPGGRVILVDGGHTAVTVVLVENGTPLAWRRVLSAGRELEERSGGSGLSANLPPHLVEEWGGRIVQEMRVVVGSVLRGAVGDLPPVVLGGGLSGIGGVAEVLGNGLGVEVTRFDPLAAPGAGWRARGDGSRLGVAWGLATQVVARSLAAAATGARAGDPEVAA